MACCRAGFRLGNYGFRQVDPVAARVRSHACRHRAPLPLRLDQPKPSHPGNFLRRGWSLQCAEIAGSVAEGIKSDRSKVQWVHRLGHCDCRYMESPCSASPCAWKKRAPVCRLPQGHDIPTRTAPSRIKITAQRARLSHSRAKVCRLMRARPFCDQPQPPVSSCAAWRGVGKYGASFACYFPARRHDGDAWMSDAHGRHPYAKARAATVCRFDLFCATPTGARTQPASARTC